MLIIGCGSRFREIIEVLQERSAAYHAFGVVGDESDLDAASVFDMRLFLNHAKEVSCKLVVKWSIGQW